MTNITYVGNREKIPRSIIPIYLYRDRRSDGAQIYYEGFAIGLFGIRWINWH